MVYSRGKAMERIQPVLRGVQDAPLEFFYKSDAVALIDECLIKAIEARTYEVMAKPNGKGLKSRVDQEQFTAEQQLYERETALAREKLVNLDESQGWVLTGYFYRQLGQMEHNGDGLRDEIAPMIYGMDVDRERKHAGEIQFAKEAPADPLRPASAPRKLAGLDLAELDLMQGNLPAAGELAENALTQPGADVGRAKYVLARIDLMERRPDDAIQGFEAALQLSKDPRTQAWSHIYLGRLYDTEKEPERDKAIAEYKAALAVRDARPDTKAAAESGVAHPFQLPQRSQPTPTPKDDDPNFDPTGKAEKDSYKPDTPH